MDNFWTEKQKQDIVFFNENVENWSDNPLYRLKFVVISDKSVKGAYDSFGAALKFAAITFKPGEYIIQQVLPENETVSFLSRAGKICG